MKEHIRSLLEHALAALRDDGDLTLDPLPDIAVERSRGDGHGDFASPLALALARVARRKPREIAERIVARLPQSASITSVEIAGPGFINFSVATAAFTETVRRIIGSGVQSTRSAFGDGRRVQVEFVSANPTGPLHVGHGREPRTAQASPTSSKRSDSTCNASTTSTMPAARCTSSR